VGASERLIFLHASVEGGSSHSLSSSLLNMEGHMMSFNKIFINSFSQTEQYI
jgi:hypothetical protein